jgi:hypothetical protein
MAGCSSIAPFGGSGGFQLPFAQIGEIMKVLTPPCMNPPHSNVTKHFNNWNACYSCSFNVDVEDGYMSIMCPSYWRKPMHAEGYTQANAQEYLNCDPNVCTKGMQKTLLLTQGGALLTRRGS